MIKVSDRTKTSGYYLNFAADVDIIKDMLSFRLMYGINKENANRNLYVPSDIYFMDMYKSRGHLGYVERRNQTMEGTLTFKKQFGDLLRVDAVVSMGKVYLTIQGLDLDYEQINDTLLADKWKLEVGAFYPYSFRSSDDVVSIARQVCMYSTICGSATIRRDGTISFSRDRNMPISFSILGWKYLTSVYEAYIMD
jgi:hypothetical protein